MDETKWIQVIAEKIHLDVPILRVERQNQHLTLFLYGGAIIELQEDDNLPEPKSNAPKTPTSSNSKKKTKGG
ncbi:MAG: hypothetical protein ACPL3P_05885 [Anaerolineales bacterium]